MRRSCAPSLGRHSSLGGILIVALAGLALAGCGGARASTTVAPPKPLPPAAPARGDFTWSIGDAHHPIRAGVARLLPGGAVEIVLADVDVEPPCALLAPAAAGAPALAPERVRVVVPRGLDVDYPLGRPISPAPLTLESSLQVPFERDVARYSLIVEELQLRGGGRVSGRLAWVDPPRGRGEQRLAGTFGEGRFDLPLCVSRAELDALGALPAARVVAPRGALRGRTLDGAFIAARAFAIVESAPGVPPHVDRIELWSEPLVGCLDRAAAKGTAIVVGVDPETGMGQRLGARQPVVRAECMRARSRWDCLGEGGQLRGFVELLSVDARIGGEVRGALAIDGAGEASVAGELVAEVCGG